jgi:hypothetical protein
MWVESNLKRQRIYTILGLSCTVSVYYLTVNILLVLAVHTRYLLSMDFLHIFTCGVLFYRVFVKNLSWSLSLETNLIPSQRSACITSFPNLQICFHIYIKLLLLGL